MAATLLPRSKVTQLRSILCIVEGGLGDRLMAIPALRHLRRSHASARITLALSGPVPYLEQEFDRVEDWSAWSIWRKMALCRLRYDLCYVSSVGVYNPFNEVLAVLSKAPWRIGPRYEHVKRTAYTEPYVFAAGGHETVINARAVGWNGSESALEYPLRGLAGAPFFGDDPAPIVLHPGCRDGYDNKRWPVAAFRELAGLIGRRYAGGALVVGAPSEQAAVETVAFGQPNVHWRVTNTLYDLAELLAAATAFVGNDSGPAHLSAALGTPTVVLMSATLPERCAPVGTSVQVIYEPCDLGGCYYIKGARCRGCIGRISPAEVIKRLELLSVSVRNAAGTASAARAEAQPWAS